MSGCKVDKKIEIKYYQPLRWNQGRLGGVKNMLWFICPKGLPTLSTLRLTSLPKFRERMIIYSYYTFCIKNQLRLCNNKVAINPFNNMSI